MGNNDPPAECEGINSSPTNNAIQSTGGKDKNWQPATVHFLDNTTHVFNVSKKAEGFELFEKVVNHINLSEKEYFSLSFSDVEGHHVWLYNHKRISKQLKGRPWDFKFEVKFYPPEPSTLSDDLTRYQLFLQVRYDILTGKLPATFASHALLGSYVAQSDCGDYTPSPTYDEYLKNCRIAPVVSKALLDKVEELHKQRRGEMPVEAEAHYLENAKKLSLYGVILFPAKDGKGVPVQLGVCAHGINIYRDQTRIHRFAWQNIIKIAYRRNIFTAKLRPGELEKNETTIAFKLSDHAAAKQVWKCAVEYHTFFRLIQPEDKPHKSLFRWNSSRFRYHGRTQFQTKMASQTFEHPTAVVQRSQSMNVPINEDVKDTNGRYSTLGHPGDKPIRNLNLTPEKSEKSYTISPTESVERKDMKRKSNEIEVTKEYLCGTEKKRKIKSSRKIKSPEDIASDSGSSTSSDSDVETTHMPISFEAAQMVSATGDVMKLSYEEMEPCDFPSKDALHVDAECYLSRDPDISNTTTAYSEMVSGPKTTVDSWQETAPTPELMMTEINQQGNIIRKIVKTQQGKHTMQHDTYNAYTVPDDVHDTDIRSVDVSQQVFTPVGQKIQSNIPIVETQSHSISYESGANPACSSVVGLKSPGTHGELVSSRSITAGNRTVETITYKTEANGVVETHVEHRVTILSDGNIDHDAELNRAIFEATNMNPDMTVEKIEVKQETQC